MESGIYDIITVGGGLGGSTLAKAMAEHGARVLVLEREKTFKDRVRGEWMAPWGVAEAHKLGIEDRLRDTCAHPTPTWDVYFGSQPTVHRDLSATTPQQKPSFTLYHPEMQEVLLHAAAEAGAEIRRGARVREVRGGTPAAVTVEQDGRAEAIQARLVVGADGRTSLVRQRTGFAIEREAERLRIAGVLYEEMRVRDDTNHIVFNPLVGQSTYLFPQGGGRVRTYVCFNEHTNSYRLQGATDVARFVEESIRTGAAADWYLGAKATGPLATFEGADTWVEHPYKDGVALVGDAAAASDPTWGQGLSLTLRDVRVLRDRLLESEDWESAGHAYAKEAARHHEVIRTVNNWFRELFFEAGQEAEARRARALPLLAIDETRGPDHQFSGPDLPANETVRRRLFGEE